MIRLVVFMGNPGDRYAGTRHNAGCMLLDVLPGADSLNWREKFHGRSTNYGAGGERIRFLLPQTFMNLSGKSVSAAMKFYGIESSELLVVHDEVELAFGEIGLRFGGGLAGHNGLKSIRDALGTVDFFRLRIGVGRPKRGALHSWVLGRFDTVEEAVLPTILHAAAKRLLAALEAEIHDTRETVRV